MQEDTSEFDHYYKEFPKPIAEAVIRGMEETGPLLDNIKTNLGELEALLEEMNSLWFTEDGFYRFYYQSFKVYHLQHETQRIVSALKTIAPDNRRFCEFFEQVIREGASGKKFEDEHNQEWLKQTRPIVEAFFHAKYFLEMAVKYGEKLEEPPIMLPSGWAALLCLYGIR